MRRTALILAVAVLALIAVACHRPPIVNHPPPQPCNVELGPCCNVELGPCVDPVRP